MSLDWLISKYPGPSLYTMQLIGSEKKQYIIVSYVWFDIKLSYMKRAVSYLWFDIKLSYMKCAVAQLVEHLVVKSQEGGGSKPPSGTLL